MLYKAAVLISLTLLLAGCQPASARPTATPSTASTNCPTGDHMEELTSGDEVREYRIHVPTTYQPEKPAALVLGFHGAGSNAWEFESYSDFSSVADCEGFIVVYPNAREGHRTWNTTPGPNNPDIRFISDLIEELKSRCNIDPNRIYASGHSNGGGMANRLACALGDRIAAIGTVSGAYEGAEECYPSQPVAVSAIHGTNDPIIPYNAFQSMKEPPAAYYLISIPIPQWASAWANRNGCDPIAAQSDEYEQVTAQKWSNCRVDADVILYTIQGGGHEWPAHRFDVAQTIWNFFERHP